MHDLQLAIVLIVTGTFLHLVLRRSMDIGNWIRAVIANERGEVETGEVKFDDKQQAHIDKLIAAKAADYHSKLTPLQKQLEELNKFKGEYEKSQEQKNQDDLIKAKKYEEAEGNYKKQIGEFSGKLTAKDSEIQDLKISHALSNEISKQNGFIEESIAMIKGQTVLDSNGQVMIKSKDVNGADVTVSLADGIKKFLTDRPHLVKAKVTNGSGSGGGQGDGGKGSAGGGQGDDLASLNAQLALAMKGTDLKLRSEIKGKIKAAMAAKGVNR